MMQPSANGIAALFQGNPGALQQRVQKEQQGKPGLPPDLKELMALQILTEKTDAAQRQQAMNQLNQAGGPNMPTVAQTLQERAKQALQARMMQAQQQAQMPPQPQPIPTAPPQDQPEVSPEMMQQLAAMQAQGKGGLDQLPSNVGENYAGGGIIAFAGENGSLVKGEDDSLSPEEARAILERMRARTEREKEPDFIQEDGGYYAAPLPADARRSRGSLEKFVEWAGRNVERDPETGEIVRKTPPREPEVNQGLANARDILLAQGKIGAPTPVGEKRVGGMTLDQALQGARTQDEKSGLVRTPQEQAEADAILRRRFAGAEPDKVAPPAAPPKQLPSRQATVQPQAPVAAPAPTGILSPEEASMIKQAQLDAVRRNPYEGAQMLVDRYNKEVGAPDTTSLQALADELASKRQRIARQQEENQGLREWIRGIAMAPRGLTSAQAANAGTEYVRGRERQFEAQDFEALQKMLDTQAKIADVKRGWNKEKFNLEKDEFNRIYKDKYDAAKALGESDAAAQKLAQEAVLEANRQKTQLEVANIYTRYQAQQQQERAAAIKSYKDTHKGATDYEAYMAVSQPSANLRGQMTYDQASDNVDKWLASMDGQDYISKARAQAKKEGRQFDEFQFRMEMIAKALQQSGSAYAPKADNAAQSGNTRLKFDARGNPI